MKQLTQNLRTGETLLEEVPVPHPGPGEVLIRTRCTLVSAGTERMLVRFGRAGWIGKIRQQPDKVGQALDKIRTDGLSSTLRAVKGKLNAPLPLGYCNAGTVVAVGAGVHSFAVGDRAVSNGPHAQYVRVPENLTVRIPDSVSDEEATFTVPGAIGLQGIRLCNPTVGETIVVAGLGLIGQLTARLLLANGCRVIGLDPDEERIRLATDVGIRTCRVGGKSDPVRFVQETTGGRGADAVLLTAATEDDGLVHQAAQMCRKRGRIVLIGTAGLHLRRSDFYEKELSFQVSRSYGPGRYDPRYEEKGYDYPPEHVRWTVRRNFEAVLELLADRRIDVRPLISERLPLEGYRKIYDRIETGQNLATLLDFPEAAEGKQPASVPVVENRPDVSTVFPGFAATTVVRRNGTAWGIVGAGNFVRSTLLPALKEARIPVKHIVSRSGLTAADAARKAGIPVCGSDYREMLNDPEIGLVLIATRHDLHVPLAVEALKAGKHVYVEKPLALDEDGLSRLTEAYENRPEGITLTTGFNRRFAPLAVRLKGMLDTLPKNIVVTVNAGALPPDHWTHDPETGGGRIAGEACHWIDLCGFLTGSRIVAVCADRLGETVGHPADNVSILMRHADGSRATVHYFSNGHRSFPKERIEVFSGGKVFVLDNWKSLRTYGAGNHHRYRTRQDKGHRTLLLRLQETLCKGETPPIPFESLAGTTRATLAVAESLRQRTWIDIPPK